MTAPAIDAITFGTTAAVERAGAAMTWPLQAPASAALRACAATIADLNLDLLEDADRAAIEEVRAGLADYDSWCDAEELYLLNWVSDEQADYEAEQAEEAAR
jgi:hypothetical protein